MWMQNQSHTSWKSKRSSPYLWLSAFNRTLDKDGENKTMTTRDEVIVAIHRGQDAHTADAIAHAFQITKPESEYIADALMPLLNRAERTAGSIEVCPSCYQEAPNFCKSDAAKRLGCPIRSGAKASFLPSPPGEG